MIAQDRVQDRAQEEADLVFAINRLTSDEVVRIQNTIMVPNSLRISSEFMCKKEIS